MLRITLMDANAGPVLRLEGRLVEPWPAELLSAWREAAGEGRRVVLDLSALTFVDAAGTDCLRDLLAGSVLLRGCSGFIAELLKA